MNDISTIFYFQDDNSEVSTNLSPNVLFINYHWIQIICGTFNYCCFSMGGGVIDTPIFWDEDDCGLLQYS